VNAEPYPSTWERTAQTRDGARFRIRPMRPNDAELERQFINMLSPSSRYQRFMHAVHEPSERFVQQMVNVDYRRTMAFAAVLGECDAERIIGIARYAAIDERSCNCEFAVAVADDWQHRGVGTTLMRLLFDYARLQGFRQTHGPILAANTHMVEFAHHLGLKIRHAPRDWTIVEASGEFQ
jgi:acetyltransferase